MQYILAQPSSRSRQTDWYQPGILEKKQVGELSNVVESNMRNLTGVCKLMLFNGI